MTPATALISGLAGSVALNAVHESARRLIPDAPRMDVIGKRAVKWPARRIGINPPTGKRLYTAAIAGDVVANAIYYAAIGLGPRQSVRQRGLLLGLIGGVGAVLLPPLVGLGDQPRPTPPRRLMTIAWYTFAGVIAGMVADRMADG